MAWEDEELAVYEPKRAKAVEEKRIAAEKEDLLNEQLPHQWNALRQIFIIRCESINARAKRMVLRSVDPQHDHLEIRREDESTIEAHFEAEKRKVKFSGKGFGYDRDYELIVKNYGGPDTTVWFCIQTEQVEQPDEIAKSLLTLFLRAEQA